MSSDEIASVYRTPKPNAAIDLGNERVRLKVKGKRVTRVAEIELRLTPRPYLRIDLQLSQELARTGVTSDDIEREVILTSTNTVFRAIPLKIAGAELVLTPSREPLEQAFAIDPKINRIIFHLFNFPAFICGGDGRSDLSLRDKRGGIHRVGRLFLQTQGWQVVVAGSLATKELTEALKETGGYAITHVGEVRRLDGMEFNVDASTQILTCVHYFLSFARGQWVAPGLGVGFDASGEEVLKTLGIGRVDSWSSSLGWFDTVHADMLAEVFPGFYKLWCDALWGVAIKECVYWYLRSNQGGGGAGIDGGLILTQTALERLAWTYCVEKTHLLSTHGFSQLRASDKLRVLLTSLEIPKDIPSELSNITELAARNSLIDGPHVLTKVRNHLVHSTPQQDSSFANVYFEAWTLAQWYLEMILLRLCDYTGNYGNRLRQRWMGQVEKVPWTGE